MAKEKLKIIYHRFFCTDRLGEADGFYEIKDGKLKFITGWFSNDASYRDEYMSDLLRYAGVDVQDLPEKYANEAEKLMGIKYGITDEDED